MSQDFMKEVGQKISPKPVQVEAGTPTVEFYDGTNWLPLLIGALAGTANQITITQDPVTKAITVAIATNPVLPGDTTIDSTGFLKLPVGTEAQRPATPAAGMMRFNTGTA
jgi:hypothetical protein